jgi:hypothetical protein
LMAVMAPLTDATRARRRVLRDHFRPSHRSSETCPGPRPAT